MTDLTHLTTAGEAHMVDVGAKVDTQRVAEATATVFMNAVAFGALLRGDLKKGDALGTARIAGIMAAKRTSDLIPLCHPIAITNVEVAVTPRPAVAANPSNHGIMDAIIIVSRVSCVGKTGVEMEVLTAASVAALTIYDMCKALDRAMIIGDLKLVSKRGGARGDYQTGISE